MAKRKKSKYFLVYVMIAIFLASFTVTVGVGKILDGNGKIPTGTIDNISSSNSLPDVSSNLTSSVASSDATTDSSSESDSVESDTEVTEPPVTSSIPDSEQPAELTEMLTSGGISYSDIKGTQIVIASTRSVYSDVYCYEKQPSGEWKQIYSYDDGFIGYWGVAPDPGQNDKFTPAGFFDIGDAFGMEKSLDTKLDYFQLESNSYWVTDKNSSSYNKYVVESNGDWDSAVSMYDESAYKYGAVIKTTGNMVGVFLCCGDECTSRDLALSEDNVKEILLWLDKTKLPQILIY